METWKECKRDSADKILLHFEFHSFWRNAQPWAKNDIPRSAGDGGRPIDLSVTLAKIAIFCVYIEGLFN